MMDAVLTTFIRQDLANKSLLMNAIAQIIIKILYQSDLSSNGIYEKTISIVKHKIEKTRIENVLNDLMHSGKVLNTSGIFSLGISYRNQIKEFTNLRNSRFKKAIENHFANAPLEKNILENWFNDINIAFFREYNNEWLEDFIGRSRSKRTYIEKFKKSIGKTVFNKYKIKTDIADWLFSRYLLFLKSSDGESGLLMLDYANSLFAAKLLSANIFADISAKEMFQNTTVILDTNILLCLNLEKDEYNEVYKSLEEIFILLGIEPIFFHITQEEYYRVIEYKISQLKKVIGNFDEQVISSSDDVFLQTLLHRNCKTDDDLDRFFDTLREIPVHIFQELPINKFDNREISDYINNEVTTKKLQSKMNEIYMRIRKQPKREKSLDHDAGLLSGLSYVINENIFPAWILTRDGTVNTYSIEHVRIGERPLAIKLDSLINMLCINEGGIDVNSTDFGTMFSRFIKNDIIPLTGTFQLEDLTRMSEIESSVSQLPQDDIINLAKEVNYDRLKGDPEHIIALKIQRSIQAYKIEIKDELASVKNDLSSVKESEKKLQIKHENAENNFKAKRTRELDDKMFKFRLRFWIGFIFQILFILVLSFFVYFLINKGESNVSSVLITFVINILTNIITYKKIWSPKHLMRIKKMKNEIRIIVDKEWDELCKNNCSTVD